ncbi:MAG: diaminopimelate epimerase [Bacteroidetes bacterium]|nr:diaminopimelate epimerase [Bacteroidota bacterium]
MRFHKYHGTGNDFILIDNRDQKITFDSDREVAFLCDRRFGIGGDGLILLEPSGMFDFRMVYYNADGKEGSMCGNGGRSIVAFAANLGMIAGKTTFEAVDGIHEATFNKTTDNNYFVSLMMNDVARIEKNHSDYILNTGSPHYVIFVEDARLTDVVVEGKKIRYNSVFKDKGINVNFISKNEGLFHMRTYERGVEDETFPAVPEVLQLLFVWNWKASPPAGNEVKLNTKGGELTVRYERSGKGFSDIHLCGPATYVFEGLITIPY